jgi:hypothetical protein
VLGEVARVLWHEGYEVTELREVLAVRAANVEVFNYAREHGLMMITCSLSFGSQRSILVSLSSFVRRNQHVECEHLLGTPQARLASLD